MSLTENTAVDARNGGYLTVGEFAALFRVEPATIYAAIQADEIPDVIRIGTRRGYRIPRASVEVYREACRVTAAAPASLVPAAA